MRLSRQQLADNEAKIRAAMTRLLNGGIPPGGFGKGAFGNGASGL